MVGYITNEENRVGLAGGIVGITPTTHTIKAGEYGPLPVIKWDILSLIVERSSRLTKEGPSIDIDREIDEIPIVILQYEDGYTAYPLDIDGIVSEGDSVSEALDNVREAISLHLEAFGTDVIPPRSDRSIKVFLAKIGLSKQDTKNAENAT